MENINFTVNSITKGDNPGYVKIDIQFNGHDKIYSYFRKAMEGCCIIDGCRIYFDANYQVEKVEREYETKGVKKMSTAKQVGTTSAKIKNEIENKGIEIPKVQIPEVKGEVHHDRYDATRSGDRMRHYYRVHCECGTIKIVQRGQLTNEIVHSCGYGKRGKH